MSTYAAVSVRTIVGLLLAFLVLSLADLYLTWRLVHDGGERFRESNPVAAWWLAKYGWSGLTAFKLGAVALVGCLIGAIATRRPRTAEMTLVFGCGALSTVLLHSIFLCSSAPAQADRPTDITDMSRWADASENALFVLLGQRTVQEELHLSEGRASEIARLGLAHREKIRDAAALGRESWDSAVDDVLAERRAVIDSLEPAQAERLRQIAWQRRGVNAFSDAEIKNRLELTAEQEASIQAIAAAPSMANAGGQARPRDRRLDGWRPPEDPATRTMNRVLAVLTADQLAQWKTIIGTPFRDDPPPGSGNHPAGPRREPR
jgi:hypothetical protein